MANSSYEFWEARVSGLIEQYTSLSLFDLPDYSDTYELWESGYKPRDAIYQILIVDGDMELDEFKQLFPRSYWNGDRDDF